MHNHHITDMVNALVKQGLVPGTSLKDVEEALKSVWEDKIAIVWSTEDVIDYAAMGQNPKTVTEEQARKILASMLHHHDCTIGITWDTINAELDFLEG